MNAFKVTEKVYIIKFICARKFNNNLIPPMKQFLAFITVFLWLTFRSSFFRISPNILCGVGLRIQENKDW